MNHFRRLPEALSLHQAVGNSAPLARLAELVRESNQRLKTIEPLLPPALRGAVKAGPIDQESWCLLVTSNAVAAKVRQLLPAIQARLLREGWKVTSIRLKILITRR